MSDPKPNLNEPKINRRLALRTLGLVVLLGGLYWLYSFWKDKSEDLGGVVPANTIGWIAAIERQDSGKQAVAISPEGKIIPASGWASGKTDTDITWNPSGNRIFFVSDRDENNYHVFRWNPTDGSEPSRRTIGSRSHGIPQFPKQPMDKADDTALITSGGFVLEYTAKTLSTVQVLPPLGREIVADTNEEGGGSSSQFSGAYEKFGNSFKVARWCKGKDWIAAVMRRDEGEILILQNLQLNSDGKPPVPVAVVAGEHVDFDVNPADGTIVFSVQDFQWPDESMIPPMFHKGNKITRPCAHMMGRIDPGQTLEVLGVSPDDKLCFGPPAVSPDGASIVFTQGTYENSALTPQSLASAPNQKGALGLKAVLATGTIYEPSWSPDGSKIVFAQRQPTGKRAICTIQKDGSNLTDLTKTAGDFETPIFSPQMPKG